MECACGEGVDTWSEGATRVMELSKFQNRRTRQRRIASHLRLHFIDHGYRILSS